MNFKTEQIEKLQSLLSPEQLDIFMNIIREFEMEISQLEYNVEDARYSREQVYQELHYEEQRRYEAENRVDDLNSQIRKLESDLERDVNY